MAWNGKTRSCSGSGRYETLLKSGPCAAHIEQAEYLPLCHQYFPETAVANIGFSPAYCRQFLPVQTVTYSILQASLVGWSGRKLIDELHAHGRQVHSWTVNTEKSMDWCIRQGLDGVITDNIPQFLDMCRDFDQMREPRWPWKTLLGFTYFSFWIWVFGVVFRQRYGSCVHVKEEADSDET